MELLKGTELVEWAAMSVATMDDYVAVLTVEKMVAMLVEKMGV
jgi:hypothetical protein